MARLDDPTLKIDRPGPEFREANPGVFGRSPDLDTTQRLIAVEQRATDLKDRFRAHFEKHEVAWVVREALALSAKRNYPTLQHPAPKNSIKEDFSELMMGNARRNVHARALRRLSAINTVKTKLQNAIVKTAPKQTQTQRPRPANDKQPVKKLKQTNS